MLEAGSSDAPGHDSYGSKGAAKPSTLRRPLHDSKRLRRRGASRIIGRRREDVVRHLEILTSGKKHLYLGIARSPVRLRALMLDIVYL